MLRSDESDTVFFKRRLFSAHLALRALTWLYDEQRIQRQIWLLRAATVLLFVVDE